MYDKEFLLSACNGFEKIDIYLSEEEGMVDWGPVPSLYLEASLHDVFVKLGPFALTEALVKQLKEQLKTQ